MRVKKGKVPEIPPEKLAYQCQKLPNRPRVTEEMCRSRGDKPKIFDGCVGCPKSVRPIHRIPQK
jgi:hypothetical protein